MALDLQTTLQQTKYKLFGLNDETLIKNGNINDETTHDLYYNNNNQENDNSQERFISFHKQQQSIKKQQQFSIAQKTSTVTALATPSNGSSKIGNNYQNKSLPGIQYSFCYFSMRFNYLT
jgi:hypothetical protein